MYGFQTGYWYTLIVTKVVVVRYPDTLSYWPKSDSNGIIFLKSLLKTQVNRQVLGAADTLQ